MRDGRGSPGWWQRVQTLVDAALDRSPDGPSPHPLAADPDERDVRAEADRILQAMNAADDFLSRSAAEFAAPLVASAAASAEARAIGTWFGRYRLDRVIGRGAMAVVYRAEDPERDQVVAIKVVASELARAQDTARFIREIGLMAALGHPHILPILESGELAGAPCFVMPLIPGGTLRQRLKRERRIAPQFAVALARQVASALEHAHGLGIIHRDIKPENILLDGSGTTASGVPVEPSVSAAVPAARANACRALVADFGIAHIVDETFTERLTFSGTAMGTLPYMSPEQMDGAGDIDARSDIYSLGCVLFEMLTGAPLSSVRDAVSRLRGLRQVPSPSAKVRGSGLPAPLEQIIARATADARTERFATAGELEAALAATSRAE